ncbi:MAG: hypothetical protein HY900_18815, partial [Deltaproteobacteria bacterium]|nr:hypothetical protein [Deltaproteobacteria bacterium]
MSRAAESGHVGRTGALAPRARLALLTPGLLALLAFISVGAEASVPRAAAPPRDPIAFASLGEHA